MLLVHCLPLSMVRQGNCLLQATRLVEQYFDRLLHPYCQRLVCNPRGMGEYLRTVT